MSQMIPRPPIHPFRPMMKGISVKDVQGDRNPQSSAAGGPLGLGAVAKESTSSKTRRRASLGARVRLPHPLMAERDERGVDER